MIINISKVDMTQRIKVVFLFIFLFLYPAILVVAEAEKGIHVRLKDGRKEIASGYDNSYAVCIGKETSLYVMFLIMALKRLLITR